MKQGLRKAASCNRYRSEIRIELKDNNLDCRIDPTFRNYNRVFVLSFKNGDNDPTRNYFDEHYMSLVEMKNVNALIKNKSFFDQPIKDKPETYEKPVEMLLKMIIQQEIY